MSTSDEMLTQMRDGKDGQDDKVVKDPNKSGNSDQYYVRLVSAKAAAPAGDASMLVWL